MTLTTIYEYEGTDPTLFDALLPLLFIAIICSFLIKYRKYYLVSKVYFKKIILFISYLGLVLSASFILIFIIRIPGYHKLNLNEQIFDSNNYQVIEGKVEDYMVKEINGQCFESFTINNVSFKYSDYVFDIGYNTTACNGGVITENGLKLVITYVALDNENKIIKIQSYQ